MAQLAERSLPTPEIRRSNPVICLSTAINLEKTKINGKEAGNGPFYKKSASRLAEQISFRRLLCIGTRPELILSKGS